MDLFQQLQLIKRDVDSRITYDNSGTLTQLPDYTVVPRGMKGRGDCTCYVATYVDECLAQGITALEKHVYVLDTGEKHVTCIVDGKFILDNRYREPLSV